MDTFKFLTKTPLRTNDQGVTPWRTHNDTEWPKLCRCVVKQHPSIHPEEHTTHTYHTHTHTHTHTHSMLSQLTQSIDS